MKRISGPAGQVYGERIGFRNLLTRLPHSDRLHTRGIDSASDAETVAPPTSAQPELTRPDIFWVTQIPAGHYYLVSLIEEGSGPHKEAQLAGLAWLVIELDAGEKLTNLVVTDCKADLC